MVPSPNKIHLYHVDLIRIIAFAAIIIIHTSGFVYALYGKILTSSWAVSLFLSALLRWGTPLFVMTSGYLLIGSETSARPTQFYRRRLNKILIPLIFWSIFYFFFDVIINHQIMTVAYFFNHLWLGDLYYHLYFLSLIAGLYVITPLLTWINSHFHPNYKIIVPTLILLSYLYELGTIWLGFSPLTNITVWFILYLGYYLAGFWLAQIKFYPKRWHWLIPLIILILGSLGDLFLVSRFDTGDRGTFLTHRLSVLIAIATSIIFLQLINLKNTFFTTFNLGPKISKIANLSLGVYLIHPAILEIFHKLSPFSVLFKGAPALWIFVSFPLTILLSLLIITYLKKIPILNRIV